MTPELAAIFVSSWNIYQKIITHNYMRHKEMSAITRAAVQDISIKTPLRVLDFGCGDAQPIIPQLQLKPVASYTGYDLSEAALEFARQNLAALDCAVNLNEAPMQDFMVLESGSFDVIHSSYAVHHLQDGEKQSLLQNCYSRLNSKGILIVIDIFRNEGQPRDGYIEEYIDDIKATWQMITPAEQQQVFGHMRNYDFPAQPGEMAEWARAVGFEVDVFKVDSLHTALVMKKA